MFLDTAHLWRKRQRVKMNASCRYADVAATDCLSTFVRLSASVAELSLDLSLVLSKRRRAEQTDRQRNHHLRVGRTHDGRFQCRDEGNASACQPTHHRTFIASPFSVQLNVSAAQQLIAIVSRSRVNIIIIITIRSPGHPPSPGQPIS